MTFTRVFFSSWLSGDARSPCHVSFIERKLRTFWQVLWYWQQKGSITNQNVQFVCLQISKFLCSKFLPPCSPFLQWSIILTHTPFNKSVCLVDNILFTLIKELDEIFTLVDILSCELGCSMTVLQYQVYTRQKVVIMMLPFAKIRNGPYLLYL